MNKLLEELAFSDVKFSNEIKKGRALIDLGNPMSHLDKVLRTSSAGIPGFEYIGYEYMSPFKEFKSLITQRNGKPKPGKTDLDVTKTSIRKVNMKFAYNGVAIYKDLYVLALNKEGTFHISDTEYYIMPVLTDRVISFFKGALFFKPFNTKLNVRDLEWHLSINGVPKSTSILYIDKLYNLKVMKNNLFGTPSTPLLLFILARHGLTKTINKYEKGKLFIVTRDKSVIEKYSMEHNVDIYRSINVKIKRLKLKSVEEHNTAIIISKDASIFLKMLASSILYAFDIFPELGRDYGTVSGTESEELYWKNLTAKIEFKNSLSPTGYVQVLTDFEEKLYRYVDNISSAELYEIGWKADDFWDFIYYASLNFQKMKTKALDNKFDITEKHLETRYYVMYMIIEGFNKAFANIVKQHKSGTISYESVTKILNGDKIRPMTILKIVQNRHKILPVLLVNTTLANRYYKVTSMMEVQERGEGIKKTGKNSKNAFPESIKVLHGAHLMIGTILGLNKGTPSPVLRMNIMAKFDDAGALILTKRDKLNIQIIDMALGNIVKDERITRFVNETHTSDDGMKD